MRCSKGSTLAMVLGAVGLCATLAFALTSSSVFQLSVSNQVTASTQARQLAERAITATISKLMMDQKFGQKGESMLVPAPPGSPANWGGFVYFNGGSPVPAGMPYSVNNLTVNGSVPGFNNRIIPPGVAQIVGCGVVGSAVVSTETLVYLPRCPFVISSSGPIQSSGGLVVAADEEPTLAQIMADVQNGNLLPGSIVSNGNGSPAITLGPQVDIEGNVQTCGTVQLDPGGGTLVGGAVKQNADAVAIPNIDLTAFDPKVQQRPGVAPVSTGTVPGGALTGFNRGMGPITLNNAVLYVQGSVTIQGGLTGTGAVIATQDVTLEGGANLSAANQCAILCNGNLTITGPGQSGAFQGLVYTQGNFSAQHITLVGTFIANGLTGIGSTFQVNDATVIGVQDYAHV
ncbi:MAG: hypothetical protein ACYCW6_17650, partial [Candidatus Xenobia bacterium]